MKQKIISIINNNILTKDNVTNLIRLAIGIFKADSFDEIIETIRKNPIDTKEYPFRKDRNRLPNDLIQKAILEEVTSDTDRDILLLAFDIKYQPHNDFCIAKWLLYLLFQGHEGKYDEIASMIFNEEKKNIISLFERRSHLIRLFKKIHNVFILNEEAQKNPDYVTFVAKFMFQFGIICDYNSIEAIIKEAELLLYSSFFADEVED